MNLSKKGKPAQLVVHFETVTSSVTIIHHRMYFLPALHSISLFLCLCRWKRNKGTKTDSLYQQFGVSEFTLVPELQEVRLFLLADFQIFDRLVEMCGSYTALSSGDGVINLKSTTPAKTFWGSLTRWNHLNHNLLGSTRAHQIMCFIGHAAWRQKMAIPM